jgi:non-specific protein-tyrosine kinase
MSKLKKALEKAKEARGDYTQSPLSRVLPAAPLEQTDTERTPQERFMPFKPLYTTTKVIKCESSFLKKNRIMPVCTEKGADQVKILRTQILQSLSDEGRNTLLVTSANPGEGKTLTAINLAISFSHQTNRTVLLVDGDIRKPTIDKYLGLSEGPGLSDYLIGKADIADILINPGMERIVVLPGGRPLTNSAELLGSPRMGSLLKELKEKYQDRFIIIDAAPVLTSADPLVLSSIVDGILIVVESEKTKREDIKKVFEMMQNKPIIGTVFNKAID